MILKKLIGTFLLLFLFFTLSESYSQDTFQGSVIKQRYIRLKYRTARALKEPVQFVIKRRELTRNQIPYHSRLYKTFIHGLDDDLGQVVYKGTFKPGESGVLSYEDHHVKQGRAYVYWLQSLSGQIIVGPVCRKVRDPKVWLSQDKIEQKMDHIQKNYPKTVKKHTFGKTHRGKPINGLLIGNMSNAAALIGNLHAGESGAELHLYTIEQILENHGDLFDSAGIIVIPVLNIDSRNRLIRGIPDYQRKNSNDVDLNRNFPADWKMVDSSYGQLTNDPFSATYRGPSPASEPETRAVIQMIKQHHPQVLFSYHWMGSITGSKCLAYTNNTKVNHEIYRFAKSFINGFRDPASDKPVDFTLRKTQPGSLPRYCVMEHGIPAYDIEGNRNDPILTRASSDMATIGDLRAYQEKHYRAVLSVLRRLAAAGK